MLSHCLIILRCEICLNFLNNFPDYQILKFKPYFATYFFHSFHIFFISITSFFYFRLYTSIEILYCQYFCDKIFLKIFF